MVRIIAVGVGGGIGALTRFWILDPSAIFPFSTLLINIIGSFLITFFTYVWLDREIIKALLTTGFCGGFTTMSAFSGEVYALFSIDIWIAWLYILLSVGLGIAAAVAGEKAARLVKKQFRGSPHVS
ncbi:MAG TPA: CrcB family protein [Bacillus sp. (in: firmicutes)]|uniref:fluoride efflux transporter FluC n=1 Tax=Bacillus litorisediminis TaxID=2922713 RepID=UPI001FAE069B|nr:CrcB family protein [Bacillus litorisediminis]HWO74882.1 CrcB family protein [Bacillus sp. (in: firmicutes)]